MVLQSFLGGIAIFSCDNFIFYGKYWFFNFIQVTVVSFRWACNVCLYVAKDVGDGKRCVRVCVSKCKHMNTPHEWVYEQITSIWPPPKTSHTWVYEQIRINTRKPPLYEQIRAYEHLPSASIWANPSIWTPPTREYMSTSEYMTTSHTWVYEHIRASHHPFTTPWTYKELFLAYLLDFLSFR